MRIVVLADTYPPLRSSGAIQLRDLSVEFARQGHEVTVLVATPDADHPCQIDFMDGVRIARLRSPKFKDVNYLRRTIGEFFMPYAMIYNLKKSQLANEGWDGVVWYSPSIFFGPLAKKLKKINQCNGYLIIRDIFPEWALDIGLMHKGPAYKFFKWIANYQYSVADRIGVQTGGNLKYFKYPIEKNYSRRAEVLHNWLAREKNLGCSIDISATSLADRKIFVYAGNMGVAQNMDIILNLAEELNSNNNIGFLFVGRGKDVKRIRETALKLGLSNCIFFDEIDPTEIPGLYAQCHIGLVSLDSRHQTHNIPGKFVSYMVYGLPVLANINPGNDLVEIIITAGVGRVCTNSSVKLLSKMAFDMANEAVGIETKIRCQDLAAKLFSPKCAVDQIVHALKE